MSKMCFERESEKRIRPRAAALPLPALPVQLHPGDSPGQAARDEAACPANVSGRAGVPLHRPHPGGEQRGRAQLGARGGGPSGNAPSPPPAPPSGGHGDGRNVALSAKKTRPYWVWIAYDRERGRPLAHQEGQRDFYYGRQLFDQVKGIRCPCYATDHWESYNDFLPPEKHVRGKRHTHCLESFNATVRHYLARFHRRTKCYSKSAQMVSASLTLLFHRDLALSILC